MWQPPSPADRELWDAVVAGVRAANQTDRAVFEAAISRLTRLPRSCVHRVLQDAAGLLAEELDRRAAELWPLVAGERDPVDRWLPGVDRGLLAALLPDGRPGPGTAAPGEPQHTRHRLLLLARLAELAQVDVGAFVDVAPAADGGRAPRPRPALVPHSRTRR